MKTLVHGDDFVTTGRLKELEWFTKEMNKKYESKHIRLGSSEGSVKSIKVLNRIVTWEKDSISIEADMKHVTTAMRDLKLSDANGVGTPAIREQCDRKSHVMGT